MLKIRIYDNLVYYCILTYFRWVWELLFFSLYSYINAKNSLIHCILGCFQTFLAVICCISVAYISQVNKIKKQVILYQLIQFLPALSIKNTILCTRILLVKRKISHTFPLLLFPFIHIYCYIKKREVTLSFLNSCFIYSFSDFLIIILLLTLS